MKAASLFLFYAYVVTLIVAGAFGALFAPQDLQILVGLDPATLPPQVALDLMSQTRFLRAIELGFGVFAIVWRRQIFSDPVFNRFFLAAMSGGIVARAIGAVVNGPPRWHMWVFALVELAGVIVIYAYTRKTMRVPSS